MVAIGITGFGAVTTRRKQVEREDREPKLALKQGGVEVVGKTIIGEASGKGMHWNTGKRREKGRKGKSLSRICFLDGKDHQG
jgi:hypothetical protein